MPQARAAAGSTAVAQSVRRSFVFTTQTDLGGNQKTATGALSGETITASYDAADRPTSVTDKENGVALNADTTYQYGLRNKTGASWGTQTRTDPSGTCAHGFTPTS